MPRRPLVHLAVGTGAGILLCLPHLILVFLGTHAVFHRPVGVLLVFLPLFGLGVLVTATIVLKKYGWVAVGAVLAAIGELATLLALS